MSPPLRRLAHLARVLLALAILGYLGWSAWSQWPTLRATRLSPAPADVVLAVLTGALGLLGLAGLFSVELGVAGHPQHRLFHLRIWLQGYFYRYVPGKVMLVIERVRLGQQLGVPRATSVVLVLWETLLLLVGAALVATAGLALPGQQLAPRGAVLLATLASLALLLGFAPGLRWLVGHVRLLRERVPHAILDVPARTQIALALGYAVVWLLLGASFTATCRWFDAGQGAGLDTLLWFVTAYVAGLVVGVTPAGLGVREGLLVAGLSTRFPPGVALAFALASRLLMTLIELILVGAATRISAPRPR